MPSTQNSNPEQQPTIDALNPFYCPKLSPAVYLKAIKNSLDSFRHIQYQPITISAPEDHGRDVLRRNAGQDSKHLILNKQCGHAGGTKSSLALALAKSHFKFVFALYRCLAPSGSRSSALTSASRQAINNTASYGGNSIGALWDITEDTEDGRESGEEDSNSWNLSGSDSQDSTDEDEDVDQQTQPIQREQTGLRIRHAQKPSPAIQSQHHIPFSLVKTDSLKRKREDLSRYSFSAARPSRRRKGDDGEVYAVFNPEATVKSDRTTFQQADHHFAQEYVQVPNAHRFARAHTFSVHDYQKEIQYLHEDLYGPQIGAESPRSISKLASLIASALYPEDPTQDPSSNAQAEKIRNVIVKECLDHQDVVDLLGELGLITPYILDLFRSTEIEHLSLSNSIASLIQHDPDMVDTVFYGLSKPNSFICLTHLSISDVPIYPSTLVHLISLRTSLRELYMDNIELTNEAIFVLTALAPTLRGLSISGNECVDDDAAPALALYVRLVSLNIEGTGISMPGLRILARSWMNRDEGDLDMDVKIPDVCEHYLDSLETKYLMYIPVTSHLISHPSQIESRGLSAEDIRTNLEAHAQWNPDISLYGSEKELKERLRELLRMREEDVTIAGFCV